MANLNNLYAPSLWELRQLAHTFQDARARLSFSETHLPLSRQGSLHMLDNLKLTLLSQDQHRMQKAAGVVHCSLAMQQLQHETSKQTK
ncbi:hypothetical protein WJX84_003153 [Apatococcus fuscideae]|uniref:Uncharacterized protein n=1 Tax=Apatococcus fuscideae TaxID=2026836 RepID=A0AAW1T518_9CHLO